LRLSLVLIEIGALLGAAVGCGGGSEASRVFRARAEMGTVLEIDAIGPDASATEQAVDAAFRAVEDVDRRLSNFRSDSELSRANAAGAGEPFALSPATWRSLSRAFGVARETDGVAVGRLDPRARRRRIIGEFALVAHHRRRARRGEHRVIV